MTINIEQAQSSLKELIARTATGEKVIITQNNRPVAQLVPVAQQSPSPRFGSCQGMLEVAADDDEYLNDFRDYMP